MDSFDGSWESTEIPHLESIIGLIKRSPPTWKESTATDDIAYFQSIVDRITESPGIVDGIPIHGGLTEDKLFYTRVMAGLRTANQSLNPTESDSDIDGPWDSSDIPYLESIIARIMRSPPAMNEPSAIDDVVYIRSTIARIMERPRTLEKPSDTEPLLRFELCLAGLLEHPVAPSESPESTDRDSDSEECWVIGDIPALATIITLHIARSRFTGLSAGDDIAYFRSIFLQIIAHRITGEPSNRTSFSSFAERFKNIVRIASESRDATDYVVDGDSAIDYIMGKDKILEDTDDLAYFQSIVPLIMASRDTPTEVSNTMGHNIDLDSTAPNIVRGGNAATSNTEDVVNPQSIARRITYPGNGPKGPRKVADFQASMISNEALTKEAADLVDNYQSNEIVDIPQLQSNITRIEEIIAAFHSLTRFEEFLSPVFTSGSRWVRGIVWLIFCVKGIST